MKKFMTIKKKKHFLSCMLLAGALLLTGCGEEPYELLDNERAVIVNYAAHIVAKYNVKQPEGYQYVYVPEDEETENTQDEQNVSSDEQSEQQDAPEDTSGDTNMQDAPEDTSGDSNTQETPDTQDSQTGDTPEDPAVTLSEALGLKGVQAVYTGAELTDSYGSVVPESGKKLLILHVTLQNQTKKKRACDILAAFPSFRVKVNGSVEKMAELSILPENLGTWEDPIPSGGSADTVILFQINKDDVSSVEQLELQVTIGEQTSRVVFM